MCGRFSLVAPPADLKDFFNLARLKNYEIRYNIAPAQKILSIVQLQDGSRKGVFLLWGLIPSWAQDRKIGNRLINARAETVAEKPAFRNAFHKRRCLIPATGFYEWHKTGEGKQAYHIARAEFSLFAFAGLWEHWEHDGETLYSCTILTQAANTMVSPIHERMPAIVRLDDYDGWLNPQARVDDLQDIIKLDSYSGFSLYPVSDWVNNPAHDDENCLRQ